MALDPVAAITWMLRGHWVTLALRAAVELGVLDHLDEPATVEVLSAACRTDAPSLARLLRVLIDVEVLSCDDGRYRRTAMGDTLTLDHPSQLRSLTLMQTTVPNLAAWSHLADAIRSGDAVFETVNGIDPWGYLSANPEQEAIFNAAMARRSEGQLEGLLAAGPLTGPLTVVDVGGGQGALIAALLDTDPELRGVVADRPDVAAVAGQALSGFGSRAQAVPTDFFVAVPGAGDVYLICNVLHDWDDAQAIAILRTVAEVMGADARLWIVERVLDAPGRDAQETRDLNIVDLHMLVMFGARERTVAEYDALAQGAGLAPVRLLAEGCVWNVLETQVR